MKIFLLLRVTILGDEIAFVEEISDEILGMTDEVIEVGGGVVVDVPIATPATHVTDKF